MKIGIVGNGMIVGMFLQDIADVPYAEIISLCVRERSREKGEQIVQKYQIPLLETDYETFLKNPEMDTVYIGISNLAHYEYTKKALEAGKHVICEKPFTVTGAEARTLAALAKEKRLFLWEAFIIPYAPAYEIVKNAVSEVGSIKLVQSSYCKVSSRYEQYLKGNVLPAFDPALAGGALYDLNIYNLHFTVGLFGKPKSAHYFPNIGYNGIDTSGVAVLEYDGFHAVCCAAKDSSSPTGFVIQGDQGTLTGQGPVSALSSVILNAGDSQTSLVSGSGIETLADEVTEFIRQYETGDYDSCYKMLDHSVLVTELVDELFNSCA